MTAAYTIPACAILTNGRKGDRKASVQKKRKKGEGQRKKTITNARSGKI